jgi:uncharacterized protein YpuA (DUF1002 family)
MLKKFFTGLLAIVLVAALLASTALASEPGEQRVTLGANLAEDQIEQIYKDFGIERGTVPELTVTNAEERAYLEGLVPDSKIGKRSFSCIYITTLEEGSGISVTTNNINWCTDAMYASALITAGVADANVKVSAPFAVSGTAALTGIYKAYEDITGEELDETAKEAAAEELVVTGELADSIGSDDATLLVNELKKILDQTRNMSDEELRAEILNIAAANNIELTEDELSQLISLCRTLEGLDISDWADKLSQLSQTMQTLQKTGEDVSNFFQSVGDFFVGVGDWFAGVFQSIGDFFARLFGGN